MELFNNFAYTLLLSAGKRGTTKIKMITSGFFHFIIAVIAELEDLRLSKNESA
jgi:hypothetical protein